MLPIPAESAARLLVAAKPDAVLLAGDYIDSAADVPVFAAWLGAIIAALQAAACGGGAPGAPGNGAPGAPGVSDAPGAPPFYMCLGNHDMRAFQRRPQTRKEFFRSMKALGARVLDDATQAFECRGMLYSATGYRDLRYRRAKDARAAMRGAPPNARFRIGIAHNPDFAIELARMRPKDRPDLLLCGHFHGGQIWTPFQLEFISMRTEKLCRRGVKRGLHLITADGFSADQAVGSPANSSAGGPAGGKDGAQLAYISRGLGCVLFPMRFLSKPEITLLLLP